MAKGNNEYEAPAINLIGTGTLINGDVNSNGDVRIDGILNGNLSTKGKLVIGETGKITGDVSCKNADIFGYVEGIISVADLLSLKTTSTVTGEMNIGRIAIEPGCKFNGVCKMTEVSTSNGNKPENK